MSKINQKIPNSGKAISPSSFCSTVIRNAIFPFSASFNFKGLDTKAIYFLRSINVKFALNSSGSGHKNYSKKALDLNLNRFKFSKQVWAKAFDCKRQIRFGLIKRRSGISEVYSTEYN